MKFAENLNSLWILHRQPINQKSSQKSSPLLLPSPFLLKHTNVSLSLPIRSSSWIADAISAGQVDIGIGLKSAEHVGLHQARIMTIPLVCVMQSDHPLNKTAVVRAEDLSPHTLITLSNFDHWRLAVETALDEGGARPVRRVDTFTTQVACELVLRGVGVAVIDILTALDYAGEGLAWKMFDPQISFEIYLMRSKFQTHSDLSRRLVETLRAGASSTEEALRDEVERQRIL